MEMGGRGLVAMGHSRAPGSAGEAGVGKTESKARVPTEGACGSLRDPETQVVPERGAPQTFPCRVRFMISSRESFIWYQSKKGRGE